MSGIRDRASSFCEAYGLSVPIMEAPMADACTPERSAAIGNAGGMGALGALLTQPDAIASWIGRYRALSAAPLHVNLWVPHQPPHRDPEGEAKVRAFLGQWGPEVSENAGDASPPDFAAQCDAVIAARPRAFSSIMGLFDPALVARIKAAGIAWFATATTVAEAKAAAAAGADAIIAQGSEAGGHRARSIRPGQSAAASGPSRSFPRSPTPFRHPWSLPAGSATHAASRRC